MKYIVVISLLLNCTTAFAETDHNKELTDLFMDTFLSTKNVTLENIREPASVDMIMKRFGACMAIESLFTIYIKSAAKFQNREPTDKERKILDANIGFKKRMLEIYGILVRSDFEAGKDYKIHPSLEASAKKYSKEMKNEDGVGKLYNPSTIAALHGMCTLFVRSLAELKTEAERANKSSKRDAVTGTPS